MSIKNRRTRESARLRQNILTAALQIFAEQGYRKVSMRKIAGRIDYSPTTIYRFFRNKEALLQAIAAGTYAELATQFAGVKAEGGDDPLATLRSLVSEYIVFCVERPDMFRLFSDICSFEMEEGVMYERLGDDRYKVFQSWFASIRQSMACGRLRIADETRVFLYLWDAVNGYIGHRVSHPKVARKPLAIDVTEFLELVFGGIEKKKND
jgi:AcrR family transcriptional regulator